VTYLCSKFSQIGDSTTDINYCIALASSTLNKLKNIWSSKILSTRKKLRLFNSCVLLVLIYGCQCWKSLRFLEQKLNNFEKKCLRLILNIKWSVFKTNDEVWKESIQEYILNIIRKTRWSDLGHVLKMNDTNIPRQSLFWLLSDKTKRGRPR
jgi:hypothetical protein